MEFQVSVKIEPSKSGKTFGIAIAKADKVLMSIKNCKLMTGQNGQFVSGPSSKMDDGSWFNYLFMDRSFGDYVSKLAIEAMDKPAPSQPKQFAPSDQDIPF